MKMESEDLNIDVKEYINFLLESRDEKCLVWPPDVFAVCASLLERHGGYVSANEFLLEGYEKEVTSLADAWNRSIIDCISEFGSAIVSADDLYKNKIELPIELEELWLQLLSTKSIWSKAAAKLLAISDAACIGYGVRRGSRDSMELADEMAKANDYRSWCSAVKINKGRVLPKQHTPQKGLTLRAFSHNLAWLRPSGIDASWHMAPKIPDSFETINFVVVPWPFEIDSKSFEQIDLKGSFDNETVSSFTYTPNQNSDIASEFNTIINSAKDRSSGPIILVLPELAVSTSDFAQLLPMISQNAVGIITGVAVHENGRNRNETWIVTDTLSGITSNDLGDNAGGLIYRQSKHHRWCLDRDQVLQYELGSRLPSARLLWENISIPERKIRFTRICEWLSFCVVICEDLVRQDLTGELLRAVGPNMVVALLMDGPQITQRWGAKYAAVLADDPGSSVLTVTSLGMSKKSKPRNGDIERSNVIGYWRDAIYGDQELALEDGAKRGAGLLSVSYEKREEWTADGRGDGYSAYFPVFSGWQCLDTSQANE